MQDEETEIVLDDEVETEEVLEDSSDDQEPPYKADKVALQDPDEEEAAPVAASAEKEEDELEDYSESVQRRIRKLTAKYREEERQRQAATEYAENVTKRIRELEEKLREREGAYVSEYGTRLERELEAAKAAYRAAHDEGDADALFEAQQRISKLALEQSRYEENKIRVEREASKPREEEPVQQQQQYQQAPQPVNPDPKAQSWAERNQWFGEDQSMTYAAFGIHRQLIEEEGFDPSSDEYYNELDKRIRADFPNRFEAPKKRTPNRVASAETPASRSSKKGRRTVKLTESQVAIARKLGVPLEEYAKYVKE